MITPERTSLSPVLAQQIQALARETTITNAMHRYRSAPSIGSLISEVLVAREELYAAIASTLHAVASLAQAEQREQVDELIVEWKSEIAEFATKDDPYYNGVRQCLQDLAAIRSEGCTAPCCCCPECCEYCAAAIRSTDPRRKDGRR